MKRYSLENKELQTLCTTLKATADAARLKIIDSLRLEDCSVQDLASILDLSLPTVSHHLHILRQAGLVDRRREGRHRDYYLVLKAHEELAAWFQNLVENRKQGDQAARRYRERVIGQFIEDEVGQLPSHPRRRGILMEWLCDMLKSETFYDSRQLQKLWGELVRDSETLIDELTRHGYMKGNGKLWIRNEVPS
jgi:DNA-binding transcriptional ArsR family regulator